MPDSAASGSIPAHDPGGVPVVRPDQDRKLLRSLGLLEGEESDQPKPDHPSFDGGPRELAPFTDPEVDHNAVVAQLLQEDRWRRRGA